jgi:hypothetical protein
MPTIAIVNKSSRLSDTDASLMTRACQLQLTKHAAPALLLRTWKVKFFKSGAAVPDDAFPIIIMDDPDQANALGYHTIDDKGKPWGRVFAGPILNNGGTALSGSMSVSCILSHEVLETVVDYNVNLWADRCDGTEVAVEVCDPVEADSYDVFVGAAQVPVAVSNFVMNDWFDAWQVGGKFDWMGTVNAPLQMSAGGYVIVRNTSTGEINAVWGSKEAEARHAMIKPSFPVARTSRRSATHGQ